MTTTVAPNLTDSEAWPTLGRDPTDTTREGFDTHSFDPPREARSAPTPTTTPPRDASSAPTPTTTPPELARHMTPRCEHFAGRIIQTGGDGSVMVGPKNPGKRMGTGPVPNVARVTHPARSSRGRGRWASSS